MEESLHSPDDLDEPLPQEPQALLDQFQAYAVWHPRLVQVQRHVLDTIWEPADVAFVVVCGTSGVGKSKLAEVLARRLNTPKQGSNGQGARRALLINTRPPDGALFHRTDFYQKGLTLLGKTTIDRHITVDVTTAEHLVEKKRPRGKAAAYPDNPEVRDAYEEELRRLALRTVILDEAQHLIQSGDGKQPKDQLNWIKSMTTETGVLHILIGTYDLLPFCDHDGLLQRWWYFFEGSLGCIGILKQWLVRALYRALREASAELTRAHLEKSVLPDAKWERMRADARSGEAEFQYADRQNGYLSNLASMPTFVPKPPALAPASPSTPSPKDVTVDQKARNPKRRVGEPSPRRDQVGTAQAEGEATHCSFSGPIQLEVGRLLESTVEVVQCPTCGSVSKAEIKGQSVVIAPHPPRKLRAVRNVTRWMEQGTAWVLVQKKE